MGDLTLVHQLLPRLTHFVRQGDWREAAGIVDPVADAPDAADDALLIRALLRELIGDFTGALEDLGRVSDPAPPVANLTLARVLARIGFQDEAGTTIDRFLERHDLLDHRDGVGFPYTLGVAGRRHDMAQLGVRELDRWDGSGSMMALAWVRGTIAEQLLCLGAYETAVDFLSRHCRSDGWATDLETLIAALGREGGLPPAKRTRPRLWSQLLDGVRGWFSVDEAEALAHVAEGAPAGHAIVELGSFYGRSAIALSRAQDGRPDRDIHLVDPHEGLECYGAADSLDGLTENLRHRGLLDRVVIHRTTGTEAARGWDERRVGLLFIDARHDEESVREDIEAWRPHLAPGAVVAFHDANQPGPSRVARLELGSAGGLDALGYRDSLLVTRMPDGREGRRDNGPWLELLRRLEESYGRWSELDRNRVVHQLEKQITLLGGER